MARRSRETDEERRVRREEEKEKTVSDWVPRTEAGKKVKSGEITSLDDFFAKGFKVMEPEIVDALIPVLKDKLVDFKKTTRVTRQGRNFAFRASVLIGDGNSYIGIGTAKDKEKYPSITKATRNAKLNMFKVRRGAGSWEERSKGTHSVPFKVSGKSASVIVNLLPAPRGTGLVVGDKIKDVMKFAGVKDVWSKTKGNTGSTLDFVQAAIKALAATNNVRYSDDFASKMEESR
ncbi:MAG: 30S ribosomal protein S5 [archaeon]|nr:30S ribosomal protein S5 [archaeon]